MVKNLYQNFKANQKNFWLSVAGLAFMFLLLYYIFGATSSGIYCFGEVLAIKEVANPEFPGNDKQFDVKLAIKSGPWAGKTLDAEHFETPGSAYNLEIKKGDRVLTVVEEQQGQLLIGIDEYFKSRKIMYLTMVIIVLIALISGVAGVKAMLALFFTLLIIFGFMAGFIIKGFSPVLLGIFVSLVVTLINLLMVAGYSKKALIAGLGTFSGVVLAGIFGWLATTLLHLTGYTGHESTYLQVMNADISLKGILIAGVIIGALGAVMDVAISIASSIQEIAQANAGYSQKQLFASGMNIGRDIIGTMVNTLILAYTGASLSLILVFAMQRQDFPLIKIMNMEFMAAEIVRSLAGLFGMVLAIPITAFIASRIFSSVKQPNPKATAE
jgi:uncharacterized membrane protein